MVQDCVEEKRLIGVCHTKSIERFASSQIKNPKDKGELYSLYKQNLSTFSPEDIFSAGAVEISDETEDGRFIISIFMLKRFRILEIFQNIPYKIARCEEYRDDIFLQFRDVPNKVHEQRQFIVDSIESQVSNLNNDIREKLGQLKAEKSVNDFTFKVFGFLRLRDFEMQEILNLKDPLSRLEKLYQVFNKVK